MPGDVRRHRIQAVLGIDVVGEELVATAITAADGTHPQIAASGHAAGIGRACNAVAIGVMPGQVVQILLGPVQDRDQVQTLEIRVHHAHGAAAVAETAHVDADHRVAAVAVIAEATGGTAAAETVAVQDQRVRAIAGAVEAVGLQHLEADRITRG